MEKINHFHDIGTFNKKGDWPESQSPWKHVSIPLHYHCITITLSLPLHLNLLKLHGFIYSFKHNRTSFDNGEVNVFLRYVGKQSNGLPCFIRNCAMNGPKAFQLRGILNNQWDFGQSFLGLGLCVTYCEKTSYDENCQINSFAEHVFYF